MVMEVVIMITMIVVEVIVVMMAAKVTVAMIEKSLNSIK
jgi:hypothetical protein